MARPQFTSHLATVLTMTGVAVGLGNVWRFPYMMGSYGGSAFLFVFLFFVFFFAIPAVMAEWALGRETRQGPPGAFIAVWGNRWGKPVGLLLLMVPLITDAYYILVIGYIAYTAFFGMARGFEPGQLEALGTGLGNSWLMFGVTVGLLLLSLLVLWLGLNKGIERVSAFFMPFFGVVVLVLVVYTLNLPGAFAQLGNFLKPDPAALADVDTIFAAMGQAFFLPKPGGTFFLIYGSYLREDENIPKAALFTGLGDAGAALLAALFMVPAMLVFGVEQNQGPTLILETLPTLFGHMPAGRLLGILFLIGLIMVAFLSNIAALQVVLGGFSDYLGLSRNKALMLLGGLELALILPCALKPDLIGILDLVFGSGMQCLGAALALLALTHGLGKVTTMHQIWGSAKGSRYDFFYFWISVVIPLILGFILVWYIIDKL